jgi:hypothetical protein
VFQDANLLISKCSTKALLYVEIQNWLKMLVLPVWHQSNYIKLKVSKHTVTVQHITLVPASYLTFSTHPLNFSQPRAQPGFIFLKRRKNVENLKTNNFIAFFKLKLQIKIRLFRWIHLCVYKVTQLSLHSLTVLLIFTIFSCFYITKLKQECARIVWRLLYNAQL